MNPEIHFHFYDVLSALSLIEAVRQFTGTKGKKQDLMEAWLDQHHEEDHLGVALALASFLTHASNTDTVDAATLEVLGYMEEI